MKNANVIGATGEGVFENVKVANKKNLKLAAVIGYPSKDKKYPAIVLLHGFTGYKDEEHIVELAKYLTTSGYVTLRFDCSGFAESEGSIDTDYRLSNYYSDIESIFEYIKALEFVDVQKLGIWGNSLGGTLALCFASKNPWIKAVCTVSAPTQFTRKDNFERRTKSWEEIGYFEKESSRYGRIRIPYEFVVDSQKWNALDCVSSIKAPSLYIVGKADQNVLPNNTKELFVKANEPKKFVEIEGMDHFYKKVPEQVDQVNNAVLTFFEGTYIKYEDVNKNSKS